MAEAFVTPNMLRWARERSSLTQVELAAKLHVNVDKLVAWERGDAKPTFRQAEQLANTAHIPFGYLFLDGPPKEELPIPDLRTHGIEHEPQLGSEFYDLVQDVLFKQDWYRDYLKEQDAEPLPFINRYSLENPTKEVASDIRQTLDIDHIDRGIVKTWEEYLRLLMEKAEQVGIWIMRSGIVGNNTHRPLNVDSFRGFALNDPIAPIIFLNGKDAKAAQIFTLAHELAHLWIGASGISNPKLYETKKDVTQDIERYCNEVAAEILLPKAQFEASWMTDHNLEQNAQTLARTFKVSTVVVARRAYDLGYISAEENRAFFESERRKWKEKDDDNSSGGNFFNTIPVRNGKRFTNTVLNEAMSGGLLFREAAQLLNVKPNTLQKLHKNQMEGSNAVPAGL